MGLSPKRQYNRIQGSLDPLFFPDHDRNAAFDELTTGAPGSAPDIADAAVQAAAAEGRMRIGMGRAATFLTGLGRSATEGNSDSSTSAAGGGSVRDSTAISGLDRRRMRVGTRSNPGGIFDGP